MIPTSVGLNIGVIKEFKGTLNYQNAEKKPPPTPQPFRNPAGHFVGRSGELERLTKLLFQVEEQKTAVIVGITGQGGIGKSALAFHFAKEHQDKFPGGVFSSQVNGKDLAAVAREFARKAGEPVGEEDESDPAEIMQAVFAWRRALLIFDNAESMEIRELLPGGQCAVLVTTRDRRIPVIIGGEILELPPLPEPEARDLFARFVNEKRLEKEPEAAARILEVTGNLPLAVDIAGKFLKINERKSLKDYADSLSLARLTLATRGKEREDKNLSVRVCFNESVRLLEADEQGRVSVTAFARLAACAQSGFALSTAAVVMDEPDSAAVLDTLEELRNYSLLNYAGESGSRFLFHPLLHEFAGELAKERDELAGARQRQAAHFVNLLEHEASNDLAVDIDDVVNAAKWLTESEDERYINFYLNLKSLFERLGYWQQALRIVDLFISLSEKRNDWYQFVLFHIRKAKFILRQGESRKAEELLCGIKDSIQQIGSAEEQEQAEAVRLNTLGGVYQRQGQFDKAIAAFTQSLQIRKSQDDQRPLAMTLNSLGGVYCRLSQFDNALSAFTKSYELAVSFDDQRGQAMILHSIGGMYQRLSQFDNALSAFTKSYELAISFDDQRGQAMILHSIGGVYQSQGKLDEAVQVLTRSVEIANTLGYQQRQAIALNSLAGAYHSLGGAYQSQGKLDEAVQAFTKSMAINEALGNQRGQAMVLNSLGGAYQSQGKLDEAVQALQQSRDIFSQLDEKRSLAIVLNSLGGTYQSQSKFDEAVQAFHHSLAIREELENQIDIAKTLNFLGGAYQSQERFDDAVQVLTRSVAINEALGDQRGQAMVLNALGGAYQSQGKFDEAVQVLQQSRDIFSQLDEKRSLAIVLNSLGRVYQRLGQFDNVVEAFTKSYELAVSFGDQCGQTIISFSLGRALLKQKQPEQARPLLERSFKNDEAMKDRKGMAIVTPLLCEALRQLGRQQKAVAFCKRALAVAPGNAKLLALQKTLEQPQLTGTVKFISPAKDGGHSFGYITMDDGSEDVRVDSRFVDISGLSKDAPVAVEIKTNRYGGRVARSVTIIAAMAQP